MYYRLPLNKELLVDVKIKPIKSASGDPMIRAIGIVYDANGHELLDVGRVTSKAQTAKNEQFAINDVLRQVEERYLKLYGTVPATEEDMQRAFDAVCNAVKNGMRLRPSWKAQSTNTQKLTHFARHGLPFLLQFANEHKRKFLLSDKQELEDMLIAAAMRQNVQGQSAKRTAENRLWDYSIIYSHMRDQVERLPVLQLEPSSITKRLPALEQVKHLDRTMLMVFYRRVSELPSVDPYLAFFTVLVVYGLRPAEAAAQKPCDVEYHDTYCIIKVSSQARGKVLDHALKNEYSRRPVVISYWGTQILRDCASRIGDNYPHEDEVAMNDADECSAKVKALLIECGASEAILDQLISDVDDDLDNEDLHDRQPERMQTKIACYVLRRIFATICRSTMGLSSFATDRLLGHKPIGAAGTKEPASLNLDLRAPDTQRYIAECMERYVFDPACALNPYYSPLMITDPKTLILKEFSAYKIINSTDHEIVLDVNLEASEAGETITILAGTTENDLASLSKPKTWMGHDRLVIGTTTLPSEDLSNGRSKDKQ